jgi:PAS domain S-box-containing protein
VQRNGLSLQSEDKFGAIFEGTNDGILVADAKTRKFILANSRICEITGYSQEELLKLSVNSIHPKKDLPRVISEFTKLLQRKIITAKDIPVLRKNKGVVYCDINSKVVKIGGRECQVGFFRDITESRKSEERLLNSEEKFRTMFEGASDVILYVNTKGTIIDINDRIEDVLGYKRADVLGKNFAKTGVFTAKDLPNIAKLFIKSIKKGSVFGGSSTNIMELQLRHKSGRMVPMESSTRIIKKDGKVEGFLNILRDITERKQMEDELRKSEQKHRFLMDNIEEIVLIISKTGNIVFANNKTLETFRYSSEEIIDKSIVSFLTKNSIKKAMYALAQEFLGKHQPEMEVETKTKAGEIRILSVAPSSIPVYDKGKMIGIQVNCTDVTDRKKAEEALKESENRYRTLFTEAIDGICIADAETGIILDCNIALANFVGRDRAELIGKHQKILHPPSDGKEVFSPSFKQHLTNKEGQIIETQIITKSGKIKEVEIKANLLNLHGKKVLQGMFRDITERKKVDDDVKQSEQKLSQIIQGSSVATFVIGKDHKVIYWNSACKNLTGIPAERMIGKDAQWSAFYKEKRPLLADLIVDGAKESEINKFYEGTFRKSQVLQGAYEAERFFQKLGKSGRWLLFTAASLKNSKGQITGAIETLQDITEMKTVEEELKDSEERHRILYESSWDAIMTLAPPSWRFTSGNPATVKLFNARDEKEFITKGPWDVSPQYQPDGTPSSDAAKKAIEKAMKEGSNFFEWTHKKLSGEDFPASVLLTRMKIKDQTFLQATVRDITEQKKAEEELKSKVEELERFNRLSVGRELKMVELKKRIEELEKVGK